MSQSPLAPAPLQLHLISHTHWDREWYLSHENFRALLVDLIDHLIDIMEREPEFRFFHLDGQTIVLEDYLEIRPHQRPRLARLITEGRILIGPWYLQNDEFLTDGESTVRNLLRGFRICRHEYGVEPMMVGYVPDQFGNISQLPQILNGFGIQSAVFGRGYHQPDGPAEFLWRSPDGSQVLSSYLIQWYNNAQRLPRDPADAIALCKFLIENAAARPQTRHRKFMNGVDHLEAQENLADIIREVNARQPGFELIHSTLPRLFDAIRADLPNPQVFEGEMRDGDDGAVLPGTASSRVHLKMSNFECMQTLRRWVEPFAVMARLSGSDYRAEDPIDYAWKILIQNHPHDSICGCSIDEVHFQMEARFRRVLDVINDQLRRSFRHLTASVDTTAIPGALHSVINIFNPHPAPETQIVETTIDLLENERIEDFELVTADGVPVPYEVLESRKVIVRVVNPKRLPKMRKAHRYQLLISATDIPAVGYRALFLRKPDASSRRAKSSRIILRKPAKPIRFKGPEIEVGPVTLENEHILAQFHANGTFDLEDRAHGRTFTGLHLFEDTADKGNEYIYMPATGDTPLTTADLATELEVLERTELRQRVRVTYRWKLPPELDDKTEKRIGKPLPYPLTSTFTLARGARHLEIETTLDNTVKDHRLRVLFPTHLNTHEQISDVPFEVIRRPLALKTPRTPTHTLESFFALTDGRNGLAVFSAGMPEHEAIPQDSTLALTLLRCVDILGDLPPDQWDKEAMVDDYTPDAQCQRPYTFRYAVHPFAGTDAEGEVRRQCERFIHPLRTYQLGTQRDQWLGERPYSPDFFKYFEDQASMLPEPPATAPPQRSLLALHAPPSIALTTIKFPESAMTHHPADLTLTVLTPPVLAPATIPQPAITLTSNPASSNSPTYNSPDPSSPTDTYPTSNSPAENLPAHKNPAPQTAIIRLVNYARTPQNITLVTDFQPTSAQTTNLLETPDQNLPPVDHSIATTLPPKKISTLQITF